MEQVGTEVELEPSVQSVPVCVCTCVYLEIKLFGVNTDVSYKLHGNKELIGWQLITSSSY